MATTLETIVTELSYVLRNVGEMSETIQDKKVRRLVDHSYEHLNGAYTVLRALSELEPLVLSGPVEAHAN